MADRSNAAIDIVDTTTDTVVGEITGFVGFTGNNDTSGPDGVLVIDDPHQLWAGDGGSTVKVFSLDDNGLPTSAFPIATISTGGLNRADELAFDSRDKLILIANDAEDTPFVTFISVTDLQVVGKIDFPNATDGIEQTVYDPKNHKFYVAIPASTENPGGEIVVIEPNAMRVTKVHPVDECSPHGLALGPDQNLLVGCNGGDVPAGTQLRSIIMDARNGDIVATITQVGGSDEVWFNPGDNHYYLAASSWTKDGLKGGPAAPVLGIIDAGTNTFIQNVPTGPNSHSVAAESVNNKIYVPLRSSGSETGGIGVYGFQP